MNHQTIIVTLFVIIHHTIASIHGGAHTELQVLLTSAQNAFVYINIIAVPLIAVVLVWTRFATTGLVILLISMAGALAFDIYHHYILVSPDNIAHLPDGPVYHHHQFIWTAHALTIMQSVGVVLATYLLQQVRVRH
ncbi:MAG: hypothetical protein AAF639_27155 [Chloroflexota bacterium]